MEIANNSHTHQSHVESCADCDSRKVALNLSPSELVHLDGYLDLLENVPEVGSADEPKEFDMTPLSGVWEPSPRFVSNCGRALAPVQRRPIGCLVSRLTSSIRTWLRV